MGQPLAQDPPRRGPASASPLGPPASVCSLGPPRLLSPPSWLCPPGAGTCPTVRPPPTPEETRHVLSLPNSLLVLSTFPGRPGISLGAGYEKQQAFESQAWGLFGHTIPSKTSQLLVYLQAVSATLHVTPPRDLVQTWLFILTKLVSSFQAPLALDLSCSF